MGHKREGSKYKISRRVGIVENLWGRAKDPVNKRNYPPGEHGPRHRGKQSDYGTQLAAKQKLRGYYANIGEKQFRRYYEKASNIKGDTGLILVQLLERRLDAVVYRMKFAPTPHASRQLVSHKHVLVNGNPINIPSYQVQDGDKIALRERALDIPMVHQAAESSERDLSDYMEVDLKKFEGKYLRSPELEEVPYPVRMEPNLVVEFYSR